MNTGLWKVHTYYRTTDAWYRWHVEGTNAETGAAFSWSVPTLDDPGFDLSAAIETERPRSAEVLA